MHVKVFVRFDPFSRAEAERFPVCRVADHDKHIPCLYFIGIPEADRGSLKIFCPDDRNVCPVIPEDNRSFGLVSVCVLQGEIICLIQHMRIGNDIAVMIPEAGSVIAIGNKMIR